MQESHYKEYETIILGTQLKRLLEKKAEPLMAKYALREVEFEILAYLSDERKRDTAKDIMKRKHISKAHISKSVENLRAKGFIRLEEDAEDRRMLHICPTEAAKQVVEDFLKVHNECKEILFYHVTEQEKEMLTKVFYKMQNNVSRELEKL